jgi:RsiW-degrading membrane proteinase PrsW (M82 family)
MSENLSLILLAISPAIILITYIYLVDKQQREPLPQILKGFLFGIISAFLAVPAAMFFADVNFYTDIYTNAVEACRTAFFGAALPEEAAKLFMLWLLVRKNKYFDERIDGIVYAVAISMGFAAFENLLYLFSNYEQWLTVGLTRAALSVPAHYAFAVLMGYYYSKVHFGISHSSKDKLMTLLAPVIVHTIFDWILFSISITPALTGILSIVFIIFVIKMHKYANARIKDHLS